MKHIYYKNDFAVEITLLNASGDVVAPPDWQWHIEFTDGRRKYICSVDKGNAKVVGNTIMCYIDNHKFCCGEVGYKFVQAIPDLNYLDGFQNLITPKALPIELWEQESDNDVNIQSSVVPAYVVYDAYMTAKANGYTGTAEEYYNALNHIVDINKKESERVEAEANRVTSEQQRVENFAAMESALTTATTKANTATNNATQATKQATTATKRANDISADLEAKREADYWRGGKGEKGDDGVSPTVKTSKAGKVTTIEITDAQGTHTATVNDGDSVEVVQSTGNSTTSVMSQKAVSDALSTKVGKTDIKQSTGTSTTAVMSQKAVSDKLSEMDGEINGTFTSQDIFTSDTIPSGINVVFTIIPKQTSYNILVYDANGVVLERFQSTTATIGQTYTHEYLLPSNYAKVCVGDYGEIDLNVSFEYKKLPQLTEALKQHEDTLSSHTNNINTLEQDVETLYDRTTIIGEPIKVDVEPTSVDDNKFLYVNEATPIEDSSSIQSIANYNVESFTGKINITAHVSTNSIVGYAFVMDDGSFVMGSDYAKGGSVATHEIEIPQGATILRFSYFIEGGISAVVYQKNAQNIKEAIAKVEKNTNIALSFAGANATSVSRDTLNNDTLILDGVPSYTKKDCIISFSANVTSFNSIEFGLGYGSIRGLHVTINGTNIIYKTVNLQRFSETHSLTIGTFIRCSVFHALKKYVFVVSTLSGTYFKEFNETDLYYAETYGLPYVYADATTTLTNIKLSMGGADFKKPVWLFGDSYFTFDVKRWTYHVISYGFTNYMLCGLAGATSQVMYEQLEYCLKFGTPKYIVWCLGMNDGVNATPYQTYFEKVKALCDSNGIELILQTIPSTTTANKSVINGIVKNSGCRYIDAYSAVGANDSGVWYEGYNDDGTHPTELGAKAIASQVLVDFPEIMQY